MTAGLFRDRVAAGQALARRLSRWQDADAVVLGLPRGGMPVAGEIARVLRLPLDIVVVGKVGVPGRPELAMGAVGENGASIVNPSVVAACRVSDAELAAAQETARAELERRVGLVRRGRLRAPVLGRTAIVVDDGAATGATAEAGCRVARQLGAARVVLAIPVAARDAVVRLRATADEVTCLTQPEPFLAVGESYEDFTPVSDAEVEALLDNAPPAPRHPPAGPCADDDPGRP